MSPRLDVKKTYKLFIGGKFPRSKQRCLPAQSTAGEHLDNFAHASRKDFRDAVVAARSACDGWTRRVLTIATILYRATEILQTARRNSSSKLHIPPVSARRRRSAR